MSMTKAQTSTTSSVTMTGDDERVEGIFNYWSRPSPPAVEEVFSVFNGTSSSQKSVRCDVSDIRTHGLSSFHLASHGFQILRHSSSLLPPQTDRIPDFHDDQTTKDLYWPEVTSLIQSTLKARSAIAITTTVRDVSEVVETNQNHGNPRANKNQRFQPFTVVHGDYTPPGARGHMRAMLPTFFEDNGMSGSNTPAERERFFSLRDQIIKAEDEAMAREGGVTDQWSWSGENYAGPRWMMLSVWRPLETVHRDPLAVMDPKSLLLKPGQEGKPPYALFTRMYRDRPGFEKEYQSENLLPLAPENGADHKWYYISEQKPDEVYALKLFDSEAQKQDSNVAPWVAHSAFPLPGQEGRDARKSVEIRVMVIF
ncbi:uncharacterized protein PV06_08691 [Exophiala oligosperma]|uniref:GA4 desaturase n=1 Tax=Exophiala oligosperma TaxID=215243 RepID=A0A0D2D6N6_9EURO|nr:uncharacterized protein PV06_08691 [Exophiala oligosperma]KIW38863.1 hypothetical protein PV06_08691 [Exophiala oligosperma]